MDLFVELAEELGLKSGIESLFSGEKNQYYRKQSRTSYRFENRAKPDRFGGRKKHNSRSY